MGFGDWFIGVLILFNCTMRRYGLIGYPLGHSFSKKFFTEKFGREDIPDAQYDLFPLERIADLPAVLTQYPELCGLNVTIPYKESVIPLLHELDETARAVGAVNCIKIQKDKLIGYNTDVVGFERSLNGILDGSRKSIALILGTGGASKAVTFVLKKLGIPFQLVSRHPKAANEISYDAMVAKEEPATLLINTTPSGTFPDIETMPPVPIDFFKPGMFVYDLIYNPAETLLLREAKSRGCLVKNGLEMLKLQAEAAWEIWQKNP